MDLALFDFDGTITHGETMPHFLRASVRPHRVWIGGMLLMPFILGYKARLVSGTLVRALVCRVGFRGIPAHELEAHGRRFAREVLPTTLRPQAMQRIAWHQRRGDVVVVVSGGLDLYLGHWCKEHGVQLLCSSLELRDGRFTGRYRGRQCVRQEKARLVREHFPLAAFGRVFAYGDTPEDRQMLALADEPYYRWRPLTGQADQSWD